MTEKQLRRMVACDINNRVNHCDLAMELNYRTIQDTQKRELANALAINTMYAEIDEILREFSRKVRMEL